MSQKTILMTAAVVVGVLVADGLMERFAGFSVKDVAFIGAGSAGSGSAGA